jgi:hypothetical protein
MIMGLLFLALLFVGRSVANVAHIVWGAILLALFFIVNGIYMVARGRIGPNLGRFPESGKVLSYPQRLAVATLYVFIGVAILLLVLTRGGF